MSETEREVKMWEIDLDLDEAIIDGLVDHAKKNIVNDRDVLINWAVNDILKKMIKDNS